LIQCAFVFSPNGGDERREISRSQSLLADQNNRRVGSRCQRENLREVSVKRDYHSRFTGCVVKDFNVCGLVQFDFSDVNGVPAILSQNHGCGRWQSLIENYALHAASM